MTEPEPTTVFRLPRSAYLAVLFLVFCALPLAFAGAGGDEGGPAGITWRTLLILVPVVVALFIARTATVVSARGFRVRALVGSRTFGWDEVRGLSVTGRAVYVVLRDGAVRLPCVRTSDLSAIARVSHGRLPPIAEPVRRYALSRRPRRRVRRRTS